LSKEKTNLELIAESGFQDIMRAPKVIAASSTFLHIDKIGPDLEEAWQAPFGRPSMDTLRRLGHALGDAQAHLWNKFKFVHSDIKKDNLTKEGKGFGLIDFGETQDIPTYFIGRLPEIHVAVLYPATRRFEDLTSVPMAYAAAEALKLHSQVYGNKTVPAEVVSDLRPSDREFLGSRWLKQIGAPQSG
jgi:hypothetical protein